MAQHLDQQALLFQRPEVASSNNCVLCRHICEHTDLSIRQQKPLSEGISTSVTALPSTSFVAVFLSSGAFYPFDNFFISSFNKAAALAKTWESRTSNIP